MTAQILSDLHTERYQNPLEFLRQIQFAPGLTFLILAGDIVSPGAQAPDVVKEIFEFLATKAIYVIFIVGNHEYYGSHPALAEFVLGWAMPDNFTWLQENDITIEGVHFYGGAMWFRDDPFNFMYRKTINDFEYIHGYGDGTEFVYFMDWVNTANKLFSVNAKQKVQSNTVVVSHHLPCALSIPPEFKTDEHKEANRFFLCDQTPLIFERQPKLWIHGHTHNIFDYTLEATRVICNPYGYPPDPEDKNDLRSPQSYPVVLVEL
jgi:predicted phosphodiesterase